MENTKTKQRIVYLDILNILSCFAVVALHCSGGVFTFDCSKTWWLAITVQSIAHFSIPCFFMICGANLLEYRKKQKTTLFFKRRLIRTVIPFLFWSLLYMIYNYIIGYIKIVSVKQVLNMLMNNEVVNIFWFFYAIFAIYLFIPILSVITDNASKKLLWYLCALCFFGTTLIRAINIYSGLTVSSYFILPMASGFVGYVLLGFLLKTTEFGKKPRLLIYLSGIIGLLGMIFGTYFLSNAQGKIDIRIMDYNSICCLLISVAAFVLIKNFPIKTSDRFSKIIAKFSSFSLSIYTMQIFALAVFEKIFKEITHRWHYMLWAPILIYFFLAFITCFLKKIPLIKIIVP